MKPTPIITGAFELRPLEFAVWLLIALSFTITLLALRGSQSPSALHASEMWRMDLNSASFDDIMTLPGMTSRRAHAMIAAREKCGGFQRVSDIVSVPGFTSVYLKRIENMVETPARK